MDIFAEIERSIRQRDPEAVLTLLFDANGTKVRPGLATETYLWDFKQGCPSPSKEKAEQIGWSHIASDVLAFHNNKGGILIFGIEDQSLKLRGVKARLDGKLFNDQIHRYLSDRVWVEFYRLLIQEDQSYLGMAIIPPRGPLLERFLAPSASTGKGSFSREWSAVRERDSTKMLSKEDADELARSIVVPTLNKIFYIDEPNFRILHPDYDAFVLREGPCRDVEAAMKDPRSSVTAVTGIGGTGKTALATWATVRAYTRREFSFIVSITAKDRELSPAGIRALQPALTSFESLLDTILRVLGFTDSLLGSVEQREADVRTLLENSNGLLFIDNLETVDDARIIRFLDSLPIGVRALTTSRRTSVRVSVHPVPLGPLTDEEAELFIDGLSSRPGSVNLQQLSGPEKVRISRACDGLPLAIKWTLTRSKSAAEAMMMADSITATQKKGEELLEFCFRRVFDDMSGLEKSILEVLSLFQRPLPTEAIVVATGASAQKVADSLDDLLTDSMVASLFEAERNDYCFTLFPVTKAFVSANLNRQPGLADKMRTRLADWFEAKEFNDPTQRLVVREIRQGRTGSESALVDLAIAAEKQNDLTSAQALYEQALTRNASSWKAARSYAEFFRHKKKDISNAIRLYEQAAANAPRKGPDRALIYREWGMLLRDSGDPQATDQAIANFGTALEETPNDVIATHALAHMLMRKGNYVRVKSLLKPLVEHSNSTTRKKTYPILLEAYDQSRDMLEAATLRAKMSRDL
jgi:tetratricopeptide (TPR) repeat protein